MNRRKLIGTGMATLALAGCASNSKFQRYSGPEVTRMVVQKGQRRLYLLHNDQVLKAYQVDLGSAPVGPKQFEGDGKTPEGSYLINRRNPNSEFHLSLGVSYPTPSQIAFATEQGKKPGGDIFVHGGPRSYSRKGADWTAGCIAVTDDQIEEIYAMVSDGTQIDINP